MEYIYGSIVRIFIITLGIYVSYIAAQEECKRGGCFPATGDLLVGREDKLSATSTCGLRGASEYCILSFLDKKKKCFYCDSRKQVDERPEGYRSSHLPKYVVTREPSRRLEGWWQSVNGQQNVTIQLDLESEFVFTHLIMTFKTFRPKAMYIERSWNYGRDWSVYRYFAFDCEKSFPGVQRGPQKKIDDVICEEKYSKVEPSTEGEVVMKVLDPIIQQQEDPYSLKVQNLLKLTNLRIHFTELHTFGDDVLGDSPEVNQKYYYALYEMVVRGSCSCYGHAEQCIPARKEDGTLLNNNAVDNMVHGQCKCTHNTKGRNCELCKDGYNDEPWRPAYRDQLNVCRKCNCNGHTEKCHFDPAVYNATGGTSGGVCDDCQHNTAGRQCELCKPLYYRDPYKNIFDEDVCKPCDCDPSGSFGGGECETITDKTNAVSAGRCICKQNVEGLRCDSCKDGFWNLLESNSLGCQSCNCNSKGTVDRAQCDSKTGTCRCKRHVTGLTCSKCLDEYWNLGSTPEGCESCQCDVGGARNSTCDDITGSCSCKPNLMGRKCDEVRPGYYYGNLDQVKSEAENAIPGKIGAPFKVVRQIVNHPEGFKTWTGDGYLEVKQGSVVDFTMITVPRTGHYDIIVRYDKQTRGKWDDVRVKVTKSDGSNLGGDGCPPYDRYEAWYYPILPDDRKAVSISSNMCFQQGASYQVQLTFQSSEGNNDGTTNVDSVVLIPQVGELDIFKGREGSQLKQLFDDYNCKQYFLEANNVDNAPEVCKKLQFSISAEINNGGLPCNCDAIGTNSTGNIEIITCKSAGGQCPCKPGVVGRRCDQCAPGYFGFGDTGCTACACNATGSKDLFCHGETGQCECNYRIKGRQCNSCPNNHFGFPNCLACRCNEHSSTCHPVTGECTNCKDNTAGPKCNLCAEGYYGDATAGTEKDCKRCQCPGGSSFNQFSNTCYINAADKVICDNCTEGYTGDQCDKCLDGYYGFPLVQNGTCKKCECNGNIDPFANGKCNPEDGACYNCTNNSAGNHCERCKEGYFGNAKNQTCRACICNSLGTNPLKKDTCHGETGQCECLPNVEGQQCDRCKKGYYNLASAKGCIDCNCDSVGSVVSTECNQLDGQCRCRNGFGGRDCSECEDLSWGNPKENTCQACGCNPVGSIHLQCNRTTGACECEKNVVGLKCDMCAPRTAGVMPKCEDCHTCNDDWVDIIDEIEKNITNLLTIKGNLTLNVSDIQAYTREIKDLKKKLEKIEVDFSTRRVKAEDVNELRQKVVDLMTTLNKLNEEADQYIKVVEKTIERNGVANNVLDELEGRVKDLKINAQLLKENVTKVIESNIGGALNSSRDSLRRSREANKVVDESEETIKESKKFRKAIKKEIQLGEPTFEGLDQENNDLIDNLTSRVEDLESKLAELNEMLCGGNGCGGCTVKGCETCGAKSGGNGSCNGVKNLAQTALLKASEAKTAILKKLDDANALLKNVQEVEATVNTSMSAAESAEKSANTAKSIGEAVFKNITTLIQDITDFLATDFKHPNESKALAVATLSLNISLTPEEVKELGRKIRDAVASLTGVDKILNESKSDYDTAINLKKMALEAKERAIAVMNRTMAVIDTLQVAMTLQTDTLTSISVARADIDDVGKLLDELRRKAGVIETDLGNAQTSVGEAENKRDEIQAKNADNRVKLDEANQIISEAIRLGEEVQKSAKNVNNEYNKTKEALNDKLNLTQHVRERVKKLGDNAFTLFGTAFEKLARINEMKERLTLNEERATNLYYEIRRLEIRAKFINERLQSTALCHTACNPLGDKETFCRNDYQAIDKDELDEKKALDDEMAAAAI